MGNWAYHHLSDLFLSFSLSFVLPFVIKSAHVEIEGVLSDLT